MAHIPRALPLSLLLFGAGCDAAWEPAPGGFPNLGAPPELELSSPSDGLVLGIGQSLDIAGTVQDGDHALDQQVITLTSDIAGGIPLDLTLVDDTHFVATVDLELGSHTLTFDVMDPRENTDQAVLTVVQLDDQPPSTPQVIVYPQEPVSGQALFVGLLAESVDPEGSTVTYDYAWSVDGESRQEYSGLDEIPQGEVALGEVWTVQVRASDGQLYSDIAEDSVSVDGSGPAITVWITPESPSATDELSCGWEAFDPDGEEIVEESALWYVSGVEAGDGSAPLPSTAFVVGDVVACEVTATSSQTNTANAQVTITNHPPQIDSANLEPGDVYEDTTVSCEAEASDVDGDEVTIAYAWVVNGDTVLEGETELDGASFDKGDELYCSLTASDGTQDSPAVQTGTTVVHNSAPVLPGLSITPEPAVPGDTLSCVQDGSATDIDPGDTVTTSLSWTVNGVLDGTATTDTYDTTGVADGSTVACTLTADDGEDTSEVSASVFVGERLDGSYGPSSADVYIKGKVAQGYFGHSVIAPGDVDGDGTDDLVVSGIGYESEAGAVFLYSGADLGAGGTFQDNEAEYYWYGGAAGDHLGDGQGVAAAGDVDGDGYPDLLAGASFAAGDGGAERGEVYLLGTDGASWTTAADITDEASVVIRGETDKDRLGESMLGSDLDGDGLGDVLVGAPYEDTSGSAAGLVAVFYGASLSAGTYDASDADVLLYGSGSADRLGLNCIRALGDVDGDGTDDVLLGAYNADTSSVSNAGVAYVISSGALTDGLAEDIATLTIEGEASDDNFGLSALGLGDLDSDGAEDFLVGARFADVDTADGGGVYFFFGDAASTGTVDAGSADASFGTSEADARLGWDMASGDMDGDGNLEWTTGAYSTTNSSKSNAGTAYLLLAADYSDWTTGSTIWDDSQATFKGNQSNHFVGRKPAITGDMDGDGLGEWVIGGEGIARGSDNRVGYVYIFWGP
ncbi:MAG TPA: hypothetical protein QGF58_15075 [Myxococcota bacterium]|nr:hypothetical protein [Myxococcota bacterium]